jgi:hypothetical protein
MVLELSRKNVKTKPNLRLMSGISGNEPGPNVIKLFTSELRLVHLKGASLR